MLDNKCEHLRLSFTEVHRHALQGSTGCAFYIAGSSPGIIPAKLYVLNWCPIGLLNGSLLIERHLFVFVGPKAGRSERVRTVSTYNPAYRHSAYVRCSCFERSTADRVRLLLCPAKG